MKIFYIILGVILVAVLAWFTVSVEVWDETVKNGVIQVTSLQKIQIELGVLIMD